MIHLQMLHIDTVSLITTKFVQQIEPGFKTGYNKIKMYRHNLLPVNCMKVTKPSAGFSFTIFSIVTNVTRCYARNKINIGRLLGPMLCHISGFALILVLIPLKRYDKISKSHFFHDRGPVEFSRKIMKFQNCPNSPRIA
jgi:hypothetical protein